MSESLSLSQAIEAAAANWFAANGGGIPMGYLTIIDYLNDAGERKLLIAKAPGQPIHTSMGLAAYLDHWYRDDATRTWAHEWSGNSDD
jgi:hypothetical protein